MSASVSQEWGMRCPKCGCDESLDVAVMAWARLTSDGTDWAACNDQEWDDESACVCNDCGHSGLVREFEFDRWGEEKQENESENNRGHAGTL